MCVRPLGIVMTSASVAWFSVVPRVVSAQVESVAVSVRAHYNSDFPSSIEPGAAWTGKGVTTVLQPQVALRWGWLSLRLAPELWRTENAALRLIPVPGGPNPFVDPMRPSAIDLPQRLGPGAVARLDPGQSALEVAAFGVRLALTSESRSLGVGNGHSLLLSPDAPGFPRVELGSGRFFAGPLGRVAFTFGAGQVGQTRWAPERRNGSRSISFVEGRWQPLRDDRLELGGARLYNRDWQGARLGDLLPFGSLFFDDQNFAGGDADNQLLALFGRLRAGEGLELWAEFGLNDRQTDLRETAVELEHNSAWLFGFVRSWSSASGSRWSVEANGASARIPPMNVFRGQATFFEHTPISQGHTNRGHLLGSRLLERTGGVELRLLRRNARGAMGLVAGTRDLPNQHGLVVAESNLRREWSLMAEWTHVGRRNLEYFTRLGGIADLNRHPAAGDAYGAIASVGVTWRR